MILYQWARRHNIPIAAIKELERLFGVDGVKFTEVTPLSEAAVQTNLRLEASRVGSRLFRNNVGGYHDEENDTFIRYGLANESKQVNEKIKSADLIGIRPVLITPEHVGMVIGQFLSREAKPQDWTYSGTEREVAQLAWAQLIVSLGGDACFATGEGTI